MGFDHHGILPEAFFEGGLGVAPDPAAAPAVPEELATLGLSGLLGGDLLLQVPLHGVQDQALASGEGEAIR